MLNKPVTLSRINAGVVLLGLLRRKGVFILFSNSFFKILCKTSLKILFNLLNKKTFLSKSPDFYGY